MEFETWWMQAVRVAGSGTVTSNDLEYAWRDLVAAELRDMAVRHNVRVDGRGLLDARPLSCEVQACLSHCGLLSS